MNQFDILLEKRPISVKMILTNKPIYLLDSHLIFQTLKDLPMVILANNPRIKHVVPGIMKAAQELKAIVGFEIAKSELNYTGYTPEQFTAMIIDYALKCKFTMPFFIHADHLTIKSEKEIEEVRKLITIQVLVGFTSFAIDASYLPLEENIEVTAKLAKPIVKFGLGLEVEVGEINKNKSLTTVEEAVKFISSLTAKNIYPDLLAINNGSKHGNYDQNEKIFIDLERTKQIYQAIKSYGLAGIAQHGTTGTPLELLLKFRKNGIRKANVATEWQNIVHRHLPLDLKRKIQKWCEENKKDIKYASKEFKNEIDFLPERNLKEIETEAYFTARRFILAFNSVGSANLLIEKIKEAKNDY